MPLQLNRKTQLLVNQTNLNQKVIPPVLLLPKKVLAAIKKKDDGGPIDKSILLSFETHVAYSIWNRTEDERGNLTTIHHWNKLQDWDLSKEVAGVQTRVANSGLMNLAHHTYRYIDYVAVSAFVERWQPETNTFHFPFGEMTITLDDVKQILGVPVDGTCVFDEEGGREIQPSLALQMLVKDLGISEDLAKIETHQSYDVRLDWIKLHCMGRATGELSPDELDKCARGYLFYLLGCSVFPDKTKNKISVFYLGCLKDLSKVGQMAWGMAILAHLYRQLGHASRVGVKQMAGCLTILVAWIFEHFNEVVRAVPNLEYTEMSPRMCKWQSQQCGGDTRTALVTLREKLDDLTERDVCWDPYKDHRDAHPFAEVSYYCGLLICFDIAEPYYSDRVLRQFGRVQSIPKKQMLKPLKLKRGRTTAGYKVLYNIDKWHQENWHDHLLNERSRSVPVEEPWQCSSDYLDWFRMITHPYIQIPAARTTESRKLHGRNENEENKLKVEVKKAITLLEESLLGGQSRDISTVAREVYDILVTATMTEEQMEKRQGKRAASETRTKKNHDPKKMPVTKGKAPATKKTKK